MGFICLGIFTARLTRSRDCELLLGAPGALDRESNDEFRVELGLDTPSAFVDPSRSTASVRVRVGDANDNAPIFRGGDERVVAIPDGAENGAVVFHVKVQYSWWSVLSLLLSVLSSLFCLGCRC